LPHRRGHSPTSTYSFVLLVLLPHAFCAHLALTRVSAPPSLCVCVRSFRSPRWTDLMERAASSAERFASTQRTLSRGSFLAESVRFPPRPPYTLTNAYDSSLSHPAKPSRAQPCRHCRSARCPLCHSEQCTSAWSCTCQSCYFLNCQPYTV